MHKATSTPNAKIIGLWCEDLQKNKAPLVHRLLSCQQCMVFLTKLVVTRRHWYNYLHPGSGYSDHRQSLRSEGDRINKIIHSYANIATQRQTIDLLYHPESQYVCSKHLLPQTSRPSLSKIRLCFLYIGLFLYVTPICLLFDILCSFLLWGQDVLLVRIRGLLP
jgi:hypothetical protein